MPESRTIPLLRVPECDLARGRARKSVYVRTLHGACRVVGSLAALARHLGVAEAALRTWLQGREEPPYPVFLAAVEILLLAAENPAQN
ncbi:MAG: hypothetical protein ACT4P3_09385 [Betaproteobacteria bacterium]